MSDFGIIGNARGTNVAKVTASGQRFVQGDSGEMFTLSGGLTEQSLAALGTGFYVIGTAVTNVVAIPTTAAHLSLYNGNTSKSLIIAAVGSIGVTTSAAVGQISVLARMDVTAFNANPAGALIIGGTNGNPYTGSANAKASVTLGAIGAGNNVAWMPTGASSTNQATSIGTVAHAECFGRWIVKPGGLFSLATIAYAASGTSSPYIYFYEKDLTTV